MVLTEEQYNKFMKRVIKTETCWMYQSEEYGKMWGRYAHRLSLAYYLQRELLPRAVVRHLCKTKNCVNPEHLAEGTHTENMRDKIRDGTSKYKRLSEDAVRAIRHSDEPHKVLSKRYSIALQAISDIQCKRRWKHIYGPCLPRAEGAGPTVFNLPPPTPLPSHENTQVLSASEVCPQ